tara:strand:- start:8765 stop:9055 length:291 start_codon:yes stop_codon:yes gene_type:complete
MKKGPLSKSEKEFIDNNVSMGVDAIAKKLERSTSLINKYVGSSKRGDAHDLFARKKDKGVVTMTEAASMAADEARDDRLPSQISKRAENYTCKIRD